MPTAVNIKNVMSFFFSEAVRRNVSPSLLVRTFDLSSAYRQVALSERGRQFAFIRVYCPHDGTWHVFQMVVLPFGAVKSVHAFLRLARAIWWLGVVACKLLWSSFFDDYIVFSQDQLVKSSELTATALFRLLGWAFAEDGRKCVPFGHTCEALGVLFDLTCSGNAICKISNTKSRVDEIAHEINRILEKGCITMTEAQKLRGRMQFADAQIYGRTGRRCTRALRDFSCARRSKVVHSDALFLKLFVQLLQSESPRLVEADNKLHVVIITDACYERQSRENPCGIGGVLVDPTDGTKLFFSCRVVQQFRDLLGESSKQQIIFEAETLCAVVAHLLWINALQGKKSFLYVDNEGTKFSLIRGSSENAVVDLLAQIFAEQEIQVSTLSWIARVSSYSNIADAPSRGDTSMLVQLGFKDVSEEAMRCLALVCAALKEKMGRRQGAQRCIPQCKRKSGS